MNKILKIILKSTWVGIALASITFLVIVITTNLGIATKPYRPYMVTGILIITITYTCIKLKSFDGVQENPSAPTEYFDKEV